MPFACTQFFVYQSPFVAEPFQQCTHLQCAHETSWSLVLPGTWWIRILALFVATSCSKSWNPANLWNHIPPQDLNRPRGRSVRHSLLEMPKNCPRCRHAGFLPSWTTRMDYKATTIRLKEHLKIENNCFTCFTEYPWQELVCLDMSTSWF